MLKYVLISSACILPIKSFADIQVGDSNSPFKVYGVFDYGLNYSHSGAVSSHEFQSGMDYASRLGLKLNLNLNDDLSIIGNAESWIDLHKMDFVRDETFARGEYIGVSSKNMAQYYMGAKC